MKVSAKCVDLVKKYEGFSPVAYLCPAGKPTIGYGTTTGVTDADVRNKKRITEQEAEELLMTDLNELAFKIFSACRVAPSQGQLDAMASLAYNIGLNNFSHSTVLGMHNQKNFIDAAKAFLLWTKATVKGEKVDLRGLALRRLEEAFLYLSDIPD
jgi:lysozyme